MGYNYYSERKTDWKIIWFIVFIISMLILTVAPAFYSTNYTNLTVVDKSYSGEADGYIVWFEDENGTQYEFENADSLLRGKFNSGTVQGKLKEGNTYNITTTGWRIPIFSAYPNIIEYELVKESDTN